MTQSIHIHRFAASYRLRTSQSEERRRLDFLLPIVAGDALALALERAGVRDDEIVCIRKLHVLVRLRLSSADSALVAEWVGCLAQALVDAIAVGNSNWVVRFGSRSLALVDMGVSIAQSRLHLSWAWRQLGFWQVHSAATSPAVAAAEFAGTLAREPQLAVPVLRALAVNHMLRPLARLLHRHSPEIWGEIAAAVLLAAGADLFSSGWNLQSPLSPLEAGPDAQTSFPAQLPLAALAVARATHAWQRSTILPECLERLPQSAAIPLAVLALLESDLSLAGAGAQGFREAVQAFCAMLSTHAKSQSRAETGLLPEHAPDPIEGERSENQSQCWGTDARRVRKGDQSWSDRPVPKPVPPKTLPATTLRVEGFTDFGGLLYLLHLVNELKIPQQILSSPSIAERGFSWFQHRLALALQPLAANDPAALAFCGLAPAAPHPSLQQPPPSPQEQEAIEALAAQIRAALAELLSFAACNSQIHDPEKILQFVCCRSAHIIANPGWIEVRFSLRDMATEIRRTGLDIDPGYLPWLGIVLRFVYE